MIEKARVNNIIIWRLHANVKPKYTLIAEFEFFEEDDKIWLNNCSVDEEYRRTGIGKSIILSAIEEFGAVFFLASRKR